MFSTAAVLLHGAVGGRISKCRSATTLGGTLGDSGTKICGSQNRCPLIELRKHYRTGGSINAMLTITYQNSNNIKLLGYFMMGYGCCEDIKYFPAVWLDGSRLRVTEKV